MSWFGKLLGFDDGLIGAANRRINAKKEERESRKELGKTLDATGEVVAEIAENKQVAGFLAGVVKAVKEGLK